MNALDLFCGAAGGWSLGLHHAGIETIAACEIDPWRRAVFSRNFPKVRMYDDITNLTAIQLRRDGITEIDIIVGSPPCQDASLANPYGKGVEGNRTGLFFEAIRLVSELRPHWAVFENVPGLRVRGYDRVHDTLEGIGYSVRSFVMGAWHAGAPHKRNRLWIVANANQKNIEIKSVEFQRGTAISLERGRLGCDAIENKHQWNGGHTRYGRVDDGLSERLVTVRGLGRSCIAAYGDAVVPQIAELFGKAIMSLANR